MPRQKVFKAKKRDVKFYSTTVNQRGHKITKNGEALVWSVAHVDKQDAFIVTVNSDGVIEVHANGWPVKVVDTPTS